MNIHTEPTSILSAFWRRGRQSFVPLTVRELIHQHGATRSRHQRHGGRRDDPPR